MQTASDVAIARVGGIRWDWIDRLRNSRRYDAISRILGGAWFLAISIIFIYSAASGLRAVDVASPYGGGWPKLLSQIGLTVFYLTMWLLITIRPVPVSRASGLVQSAVAVMGTYMPWLIVFLPRHEWSDTGYVIGTTLILSGNVVTLIVLWHLGRSFSLVPQARKLVTSGPYSVIRHPLYLAEETMIIGTALLYLSPMIVIFVALHAIVQIRRMLYEEAMLARAFPEYAAYKKTTWRVVPFVW